MKNGEILEPAPPRRGCLGGRVCRAWSDRGGQGRAWANLADSVLLGRSWSQLVAVGQRGELLKRDPPL